MAKPIEWSETVHQDITQTVRMTVTRTWTDKYGTPHREDKPPTFADLVAVLGLMPADERVAVVGPLIGDALALQWESALTAATARAEKLKGELDEAQRKASDENKVLVAMCDEAKKRVIVLEKERDELRDQRNEAMAKYGFMVERACDEKLDGYRELASRLAAAKNDLDEALKRAEKAERVAEERENIIKAQATEIDRARDRRDEAIKRTDMAETRLSRLRERGVQITGRVCSPISDDARYYAEMLGLVVEDRDVLRTKLAATEKERDDLRSKLQKAGLAMEQRDSVIRMQDAEIGRLRGRTETAECRFVQEQRRADEVYARSSKLEAALGQAEKELHECRIALREALGGLDSVKDQNADLRRQLRRLQTGTEIESDHLTDVELNLQARVDQLTAERDEATKRLIITEAELDLTRSAFDNAAKRCEGGEHK